jgi:diguanylate cyclase (GGDEF)-like protein
MIVPLYTIAILLMKPQRPVSLGGAIQLVIALVIGAGIVLLPGVAWFDRSVLMLGWPARSGVRLFWHGVPVVGMGECALVALCALLPHARRFGKRAFFVSALLLLGLTAHRSGWPSFVGLHVFIVSATLVILWTVIEAAWMYAFIDDLTGLPGRRPLNHHVSSLSGRYSIAVADIDHFKRVNDRHGHEVGDQVLRFVAAELRRCAVGTAYRQGGEEFVVVCGSGAFEKHVSGLDAMRERIGERPFVIRDAGRPKRQPKDAARLRRGGKQKGIQVTLSIGVAHSDRGLAATDVLQCADKALYKAKRSGRNRLCRHRSTG